MAIRNESFGRSINSIVFAVGVFEIQVEAARAHVFGPINKDTVNDVLTGVFVNFFAPRCHNRDDIDVQSRLPLFAGLERTASIESAAKADSAGGKDQR